MGEYNLRGIGNSLNLGRKAKPVALTVCALLIISVLSVLALNGAQVQGASTTLPLHTSGCQILDSNNNVVYLRGVGVAGMTPDLIFWGNGGGDSWADQWQSASATSVTQTFQQLSTIWHVNMIRIFMYPEWYWLNGASGTANGVNVQSYISTLASEAQQYGIYIDLVPYQLTAYSGSFTSDPYLSGSMTTNQGMPFSGWDSAGQNFIASTGLSEQQFWTNFWTSMANNLKGYPNVIFEAWNEPGDNTGGNTITSNYMTYLTTMYNAVRGTGANKPDYDAVAARMGTQRLGLKPQLGKTNQHSAGRKPDKHRLHNTLLLLRAVELGVLLE